MLRKRAHLTAKAPDILLRGMLAGFSSAAVAALALSLGAQAQSTRSGHEVRLMARVPVLCGIQGLPKQVPVANNGKGNDDKFQVRCNSAYALSLQRVSVVPVDPPGNGQPASPGKKTSSLTTQSLPTPAPVLLADLNLGRSTAPRPKAPDLTVTLRVAGAGSEVHESRCTLSPAGETAAICQALAGPGDTRIGAQRADASMVITSSVQRADAIDISDPVWMPLGFAEAGLAIERPMTEKVRVAGPTMAGQDGSGADGPTRGKPLRREARPMVDQVAISLTGKL